MKKMFYKFIDLTKKLTDKVVKSNVEYIKELSKIEDISDKEELKEILEKIRKFYKNKKYEELKDYEIFLETQRIDFIVDNDVFNLGTVLVAICVGYISTFTISADNYLALSIAGACLAFGILGIWIWKEICKDDNNNRIIAINILKNIIVEILDEAKKKENKKVIKELKKIQKLLKCNNEDRVSIQKACNKIINDIF